MRFRDRFVTANRLRHHLLEWGDAGPVVVCLHGFLEHAHAFDLVAPALARAGHHPHLEKPDEVVRALLDFLPR